MKPILRASFALLCGASSAFAQETSTTAPVLETITVTGAREAAPTRPLMTPWGSQYNSITEQDLNEQNSKDLSQALKMVPGVMTQSKNLIGAQTSHSLYVRGRGASHPSPDITMLYDDVPRGGALYGQTFGDSIALGTVRGMTIVKNPQPVAFGSGYAMINIQPKYLKDEGWEANVGLSAGSHQTVIQQLGGGIKQGAFDVYAAQSWVSTDGHRAHSRAQQENYYANIGFAFHENWDARLLLNRTEGQTQAPMPTTGKSFPQASRFDTSTDFATLTLNNHYLNADGYLKLYRDATDFDLLHEFSNGAPTATWSRQSVRLYGLRGRETLNLWQGGELLVGADLDYSDLTNTQYKTSGKTLWDFPNTRLFSPYLGVNHTFGTPQHWHVTPSAGFRYYDHNRFGDKSAPQAGIMLGYAATDIALNYARGVNYPSPVTLQGLVQSGNTRWEGKLKAEVVDHYELALTHNWGATADVSATAFYDKGKDRFRVYMGGAVPTQWNDTAGRYTIRGLELVGSLVPIDGLQLFAGLTWLDAEAKGENGKKSDHLPYTPEFALQLGANLTLRENYKIHVDMQHLRGIYQGTTARTGPNGLNYTPLTDADKLPNITVVNARLAYTLKHPGWHLDNAEIFLAIDNLFDHDYEYAKGYPMPGITAMLGFQARFK